MATVDTVRALAASVVEAHDASLYDVTLIGGKLVVAVSRADGIDLDTITEITRDLNARLDDEDPVGGSYTLEVTSPGLERPLRTPEHFAGAVGEAVTVRTTPGFTGERRVRGTIASADDVSFTVVVDEAIGALAVGDTEVIGYDDVERARTTFDWGPAPKPGQPKKKSGQAKKKSGQAKKSGSKQKSGNQKSTSGNKPSGNQKSGPKQP